MSKLSLKKLNYFTSGTKEKIFNVTIVDSDKTGSSLSSNHLMIADIGPSEKMNSSEEGNKGDFSVIDLSVDEQGKIQRAESRHIVHNLYDIADVAVKSFNKKRIADSNDSAILNSSQYADIYAPEMKYSDFMKATDLNGNAYVLTKPTTKAPVILRSSFISVENDNLYSLYLSNEHLNTYIYTSVNELSGGLKTSYNSYDSYLSNQLEAGSCVVSSLFVPKYDLSNIEYNYILEIPLTLDRSNDFDSGNIGGNTIIAKNEYDSSYSMNISSKTDTINKASLNNCRDYVDIGRCGGEVFLIYHDTIKYNVLSVDTIPNSDIKVVPLKKEIQEDLYDYQKVEVLKHYKDRLYHKSNMYKIKIANLGLGNTVTGIDDDIKQKIRVDIENNVKKIIQFVAPANTLLIGIDFVN